MNAEMKYLPSYRQKLDFQIPTCQLHSFHAMLHAFPELKYLPLQLATTKCQHKSSGTSDCGRLTVMSTECRVNKNSSLVYLSTIQYTLCTKNTKAIKYRKQHKSITCILMHFTSELLHFIPSYYKSTSVIRNLTDLLKVEP